MKQVFLIACCFAGSLFFAQSAIAQGEDLAISLATHHSELLHPSEKESVNLSLAPAIEVPEHEAQYITDAPLTPNFFPSVFRDLEHTSFVPPSLISGLLGLLLVGLVLSGLSGFGAKNQNEPK